MEDRELLELAAKAAGIRVEWCQPGMTIIVDDKGIRQGWWNPRDDDGDALRLAVKLGMMVDPINRVVAGNLSEITIEVDFDEQEVDQYSATRRAIVRAAAEIGKQMA